MILTIAYCRKDIISTYNLMNWIQFLSSKNGNDLKSEKLLLIPNEVVVNKGISKTIINTANNTFGKVIVNPSSKDWDHFGWPISCNLIFSHAIRTATQSLGDDMFWLEPDAIPINKAWYSDIKNQYYNEAVPNNKHFMGHIHTIHMSGNGIYGKEALDICPLLTEAYQEAWDTFVGQNILPYTLHTSFIRDSYLHPYKYYGKINLPEVRVMHRCKSSNIIWAIDKQDFNSEFTQKYKVNWGRYKVHVDVERSLIPGIDRVHRPKKCTFQVFKRLKHFSNIEKILLTHN